MSFGRSSGIAGLWPPRSALARSVRQLTPRPPFDWPASAPAKRASGFRPRARGDIDLQVHRKSCSVKNKNLVVLGTGMAGFGAASFLRSKNIDAVVYDQNDY